MVNHTDICQMRAWYQKKKRRKCMGLTNNKCKLCTSIVTNKMVSIEIDEDF